jgi:hypothetical protein
MATAHATPIHTMVVGVFDDLGHARAAIEDLRRAGFRDGQIGFLARSTERAPGTDPEDFNAVEGAGVGAAVGAGLGGVAGLTLAAAALTPIGPALLGGALATFLTSVAGGAAAGGLLGAVAGAGYTDDDHRWFEDELKRGRMLVTVHDADERSEEARDILRKHDGTIREPSPVGTYGSGLPATPY